MRLGPGHAKDDVEMQWLMLQQDKPKDFVIATGVQYSVRQFVEFAAAELGITITFKGEGDKETGVGSKVDRVDGEIRAKCKLGDVIVRVDPRYYRPTEVETPLCDPGKAKKIAGLVAQDHLAGTGQGNGQRRLYSGAARQHVQAGRVPGLRLQRVTARRKLGTN